MSTDSDIILASRATPTSFGDLYDRHAPAIFRYASSRVGALAAEDVMAETFLVAFRRRASFDHRTDSALPWLLGIATNLLRRHRRDEARRFDALSRTPIDAPDDELSRAASRIDAGLEVARLADSLRALSAADRDTILLWAWGDLGYEQIAAAMRVPVGTVRSRLNRARRLLRGASESFQREDTAHGRADSPAPTA